MPQSLDGDMVVLINVFTVIDASACFAAMLGTFNNRRICPADLTLVAAMAC